MAIHSSMGYKWLITHSCTFPKDSSDPSLVSRSQSESCSVVSNSLWPHGLYSPWNSPGLNTGMGSLFPSPEDLPNPGIITSWATREAQEKWIAYPFSSRSSQPRNRTGVSFIAGRLFNNWAIREAPKKSRYSFYFPRSWFW